MNILSFDLEDWYQLVHRRITGDLPPVRSSLVRQMSVITDILAKTNTKATFFVLGTVAEQFPRLIQDLAACGHEIACHGYGHWRVDHLTRPLFHEDTRKAKDIIEQVLQVPIYGYRAAEFSIQRNNLWALEVLAELGFEYDSSIFPIRHSRYGISDFAPQPGRYCLPNGLKIVEVPLATLKTAGIRLPVAGGGYFRLFPLWFLKRSMSAMDKQQASAVTYFHPYEFDPHQLDIFQILREPNFKARMSGWRFNLRFNLCRAGVADKLAALLWQYPFTTCQEYLAHARL